MDVPSNNFDYWRLYPFRKTECKICSPPELEAIQTDLQELSIQKDTVLKSGKLEKDPHGKTCYTKYTL